MRRFLIYAVMGCVAGSAFGIRWNMPVMATWTDDPKTSVTLAWERDQEGTATVAYGAYAADEAWAEEATVTQVEASFRHVFTLTGLKPGTYYGYKASSSDGYSVEGRFWTAPDDVGAPFSFVLHNDLQGGINEAAAAAVAQAVVQAEPDFVVSSGDLTDYRYGRDYPDVLASWNKCFTALSNEWASSVFQVVSGNHDEPENPDSFWFPLMELPGDERDFVFDVGPIRFIAVDSTEGEAFSRVVWLTEELQKAAADPQVKWIVSYFHRPPYSWGERGGDGSIERWWTPLFTQFEADLVLSGHAHTYQRTHDIRGVPYVVSGGGGGYLYAVDPSRPEIAFATSVYHAVKFNVEGDRIRLSAFDAQSRVFDEAEYFSRRFVRVEPAFPKRGERCTVWYNPVGGPLEGADSIRIHLGYDTFHSLVMDDELEWDEASGLWSISFVVPQEPKWHLAFCFKNGDSTVWHNNHQLNWIRRVQREW